MQRLSPRQVQYVRLLEMTAPELEEEVQRQLDDNPALEVLSADDSQPDDTLDMGAVDIDPDDDPADRMPATSRMSDPSSWQYAEDAPGLAEYLMRQLDQTETPDDQRQIAAYIIGNIDQNGYLTRSLAAMADDLAIATGRDLQVADLRGAFNLVRSLDPAGVGAIDLRDCLLLQIDRREPVTDELRVAREIVADNFDLLSKKHFDRLLSSLGIDDPKMMRRGLDLIRQLNPKPGSAFEPSASTMRLSHITPDVVVEEDDEDGRFTVYAPGSLPQLQVERSFLIDLDDTGKNKQRVREAQSFIKLKREDAEAFIGALKQRAATLIDVTEAIVKRQADFFRTGDTAKLRPMILKDISTDTGYDLSVISRATASKYVATPMGTYPLKMFFNEAPGDDADTSSHLLMQAIKEIIDAEDKRHPLSDQAILEQMQARGLKMARRTITKYREKMGIPVGRLRRNI